MMTRPIDGRHVLFGLVAFFGLVFAVNTVFIVVATDTFTGLSTEDPYRKGLQYNETIAAFAAQRAAGWQYGIALADNSSLEVRVRNADGAPVNGLTVEGRLGRPATDQFDRSITFFDHGGGLYTAATDGLAPGQWDVMLTVRHDDNDGQPPYKVSERLWVKR